MIACAAAVLAAGARSAPLGADGVRSVKGQMLLLGAAPGALPRIRIGNEVDLIPRRDGQVLLGSTLEETGFEQTPTAAARAALIDKAASLWPAVRGWPVLRQ